MVCVYVCVCSGMIAPSVTEAVATRLDIILRINQQPQNHWSSIRRC
jgi:hypothetical protein